jgi:hypothetical protein
LKIGNDAASAGTGFFQAMRSAFDRPLSSALADPEYVYPALSYLVDFDVAMRIYIYDRKVLYFISFLLVIRIYQKLLEFETAPLIYANLAQDIPLMFRPTRWSHIAQVLPKAIAYLQKPEVAYFRSKSKSRCLNFRIHFFILDAFISQELPKPVSNSNSDNVDVETLPPWTKSIDIVANTYGKISLDEVKVRLW